MDLEFYLLTAFVLFIQVAVCHGDQARQFLLYPETAPTRLQFIGGIGIPVEDLVYESVTSGYVLKAEYFLPTKVEEVSTIYLKPQNIKQRRSLSKSLRYQQNENFTMESSFPPTSTGAAATAISDNNQNQHKKKAAAYRWILYKAVEMALDRNGYPGHICLLRCICEHAVLSLDYDIGMLAELTHIILTPSTSRDEVTSTAEYDYIEAEIFGHNGGDCISAFNRCYSSPLDKFTKVFDLLET